MVSYNSKRNYVDRDLNSRLLSYGLTNELAALAIWTVRWRSLQTSHIQSWRWMATFNINTTLVPVNIPPRMKTILPAFYLHLRSIALSGSSHWHILKVKISRWSTIIYHLYFVYSNDLLTPCIVTLSLDFLFQLAHRCKQFSRLVLLGQMWRHGLICMRWLPQCPFKVFQFI